MTDQITIKSEGQTSIDNMVRRLTISFGVMLSVAVIIIISALYLTN